MEYTTTPNEILIIEDNQSIINLLSRFLDLKKINHTEVTNGQNGLSLIRQKKFDVILLDINMPEFTGYDVIEALETEGKLRDANIFIFTATSIPEEEEKDLKKRGILGCIRKPIQIHQLLTMMGI